MVALSDDQLYLGDLVRRRRMPPPYVTPSDLFASVVVWKGPGLMAPELSVLAPPRTGGATGIALPRAFASRCCGYTPRRSEIDGWVLQRQDRAMPPTPARWCARTDRSGVGCSHREGCPLFPLLNASLRGWRDYYCDSADRWHDCARYKLSRTGRLVPITLLPNGHDAQLLRPDPGPDRSGSAEPRHASRHAPRQSPPAQLDSGSLETAVPMARFEPGPAPAAARPIEPSPPAQVPQPPDSSPAVPQPPGSPPARLTRRARRPYGSTRHWWTRLTDWMTSPA
jgi:hypothetical protein